MKTSELRKIIKEELKFVLAEGSYGTKNLRISGKLVDIDSIKLDGVDANDYPDMTDLKMAQNLLMQTSGD